MSPLGFILAHVAPMGRANAVPEVWRVVCARRIEGILGRVTVCNGEVPATRKVGAGLRGGAPLEAGPGFPEVRVRDRRCQIPQLEQPPRDPFDVVHHRGSATDRGEPAGGIAAVRDRASNLVHVVVAGEPRGRLEASRSSSANRPLLTAPGTASSLSEASPRQHSRRALSPPAHRPIRPGHTNARRLEAAGQSHPRPTLGQR